MLALSPGILIIPIFSLVIVGILYIYFYTKVTDKSNYKRMILTIALIGFVLNLIWELAHGPLYKDFKYDLSHISLCVLSSITDMLTLLLLFFVFSLVFKNVYWIKQLSFFNTLLLMLVGGISATFVEIWHINRGDWLYSESMPLTPILKAGVSPVLQFTILPLVIFIISKNLILKTGK
ncbi:hypothetical protein [Winogradskyella aquimaris]|jgi:hypothetical protein|nr:hypothetical protein [Winogradskyella aquimaris]MAL59485.1 hypothetical protein [Flavobacteriaceae bacterium]|tara:strand:+ start:17493 stop:18026 length:534 start_codon:yes stop_codon:yes gene_type:complete